jgi:NAD(P)-dependent dehydrogenase (short-subunit alcohol dehydrogenase family)
LLYRRRADRTGINGITKTAAAEYTSKGIRTNALLCGFFEVRSSP